MSLSVLPRPAGCNDLCSPADVDHCRARLGDYSRYWIKTGNSSRLINMMNVVPHDSIQENPTLSLHCLAALAYEQQFEQADLFLETWLQRIRNKSHENKDEFLALQRNLTGYIVLLKTLRGDLSLISEETIATLKQALEIPSLHQAMLNNIFAYLLYMNGKHLKAQQFAARAYHLSIANEDWFARAIAVLLQCLCDRAQGRFDIAYKSVVVAMRTYEVVTESPAWAVLALIRAMLEYETNELSSAEALLLAAKSKLAMSAISDFRVNAFVTLARVHACRHNFHEAEKVLQELHELVSRGNDKRWIDYIKHEQIRVSLLAGQFDDSHPLRSPGVPTPRENAEARRTKYCPAVGHVPERTQLMLALHEGDIESAERALGQLGKICSLHSDSFLRVVVLSGSAALEYSRQNYDQSIVFLNEALMLCKQVHLYRTLFDENFLFARVFQLARENGRLDEEVDGELLQRLREERFPVPRRATPVLTRVVPQTSAPSVEVCVESLTDTEIKVLDLLSQGLSNKDISRRLGIAVTTTKWHLKNIFGKLATTNRVGAVVRARELQLLSFAGEAVQVLSAAFTALSIL